MTTTLDAPAGPAIPDSHPAPPRPAPPVGTDWWIGLPTALVAAVTGWFSLLAWRGLVAEPGRITGPLFTSAVIVAVVGWGVRRTTGRASLAFLAQVVVLSVWLLHRVSGDWVPRPSGISTLVTELGQGGLAAQRYASPVSTDHLEFHLLVLVGGVAILLAVDLLCCGLRQAALAGLPLLLVITIAASVLLSPVGGLVFLATALGWMALLAMQETGLLGSWGRGSVGSRLSAVGGLSVRIALVCVVVATLFTAGLASQGRTFGSFGDGGGSGNITVANPLLDLRRNLRESADVPLVRVRTSGASPSYLRLTVLDEFTGSVWRPSGRDFVNTSPVSGSLPPPPGLSGLSEGPSSTWQIAVEDRFSSSWLPLPYPAGKVDVGDGWRFDPDTLDVVGVGATNAAGLAYRVSTFQPEVSGAAVRAAGPPPALLRARMTSLPTDLPAVFSNTARRVTAAATNDYDRAVLLQQWFRDDGGFTYSTRPGPGNGLQTLQRFITTDKVGYCEQFSTAMAVMARTLGIPARVAVGFLRADQTSRTSYVFGSHDLHAWPELYFEGVGWIRFEPTPSDRTGSAPSYTTEQQVQDSPTQLPSSAQPTLGANEAKPKLEAPAASAAAKNDQGFPWTRVLVGILALLVVLLLLAPRVLRTTTSRRRWHRATTPVALADAAWSEVRATAIDLELGWTDSDTVRANGRVVQSRVVPTLEARDAMLHVVTFVELTRYAQPRQLAAGYRDQVQRDVAMWQSAMYQAIDPRQARRARWWPRSVRLSVSRLFQRG
jgi:transglutaminase-like putative cysteine protease